RQPCAGERANRDQHTPDQNGVGDRDNRSTMRQVPRPPQSNSSGSGEDRRTPDSHSSNTAMSGAPARSFPRPSEGERNSTRPVQQTAPTGGGFEGLRGDNQRHRPAEDRSAPRPSYGDRGAGAAPVSHSSNSGMSG